MNNVLLLGSGHQLRGGGVQNGRGGEQMKFYPYNKRWVQNKFFCFFVFFISQTFGHAEGGGEHNKF